MDSQKMLEIAVMAADSKRAEDIVALDVQSVSLLADYFVIMHASSKRQVKAIVDEIEDKLNENQIFVKRIEGKVEGSWVLMDFGDIIVHIFDEDSRAHYNLEKLWGDAPYVDLTDILVEE
ncbi:ribosome silencing factor [Periweissella beninensis]|uniref:Ribosomal silencing factor RsfS n=1 Tax=Periweissella beninensis TaxID=504936 RepID=A0ABT0VHV3_9LACO|nr:ribosome silencing factor [Periweissella beninensis]MBM7544024.1 ribosome-associated protein [Periweissella beninensis]MCM2437418.1 ribosome silencing factor [Periweissella beninensis]MCT4396533.1 ribosome silencing factor [Periweissella beninensis]